MPDNQKPQEKKEEEKKEKGQSGLEAIVNDGKAFVNGLIATGALAAGFLYGAGNAPTLQAAIMPGAAGASVVASQPLSAIATQEQPSSQRLRNTSIDGVIKLPIFDYTYKTALLNASNIGGVVSAFGQSLPSSAIAAAGITFATAPLVLVPILYPISYFIRNNYSFKGFGKELKENYLKETMITAGTFGVITGIAAGAAVIFPAYASYFLLPAAALGSYFYGIVSSYYRKKPEERGGLLKYSFKSICNTTRIFTYPVGGAVSIVVKKAREVYTAVYDFGSAIRSRLTKAPKPAPTQAEAAAKA